MRWLREHVRRGLPGALLSLLAFAGACSGRPAVAPVGADARLDALAATCARIASCAHAHDPPRFRDPAACVEDALEHASAPDPVVRCLGLAASCDDVAVCLHRSGDARAGAFCAAHPGAKTACDGDSLITCASDDPRESTLTPCAPRGAACGESLTSGGLVAHGCLTPAACPPDATRVRCDGPTAIAACHDEILERVACAPGETCRPHVDDDGEEAATCEGAHEVGCEVVGRRSCRGSVLVECVPHGHHAREVRVDCAALELSCDVAAGRAECLVLPPACTPRPAACDRGALTFCAGGRPERVACSAIGLGSCEGSGGGLCTEAPNPGR